jgi:hypothetical protein
MGKCAYAGKNCTLFDLQFNPPSACALAARFTHSPPHAGAPAAAAAAAAASFAFLLA